MNVPILTENHGCPRFESGSRHLRNANLQVKRLRTWIGTSSFTGAPTTTSCTGGARRRSKRGQARGGLRACAGSLYSLPIPHAAE